MQTTRFINGVGLSAFFPGRQQHALKQPQRPAAPFKRASTVLAKSERLAEDTLFLKKSDANHTPPPQRSQIIPFQPLIRRAPIAEIAEGLAKESGQGYGLMLQEMRKAFSDQGTLSGRVKTPASIADKLIRVAQKENITTISPSWAKAKITDAIGFRLILRQGGPQEMDRCVQSLAPLIENNRMALLEINDYHGPRCASYLSTPNLKTLLKAHQTAHKALPEPLKAPSVQVIHHTPQAVKSSGYTALQLKVRFQDGTPGELQIRGPQVEKVASVEHLVYDIRKGKTLPGRNVSSSGGLDKRKLETIIHNLSPRQTEDYLAYLAQYYQKARLLEMGVKPQVSPVLADSLRGFPLLDLRRIHGASLE